MGTVPIISVMDNFRVDAFGNVVSKLAKSKAVCAFEVDHVFPWSRGGHPPPPPSPRVCTGAKCAEEGEAYSGCRIVSAAVPKDDRGWVRRVGKGGGGAGRPRWIVRVERRAAALFRPLPRFKVEASGHEVL